MIFGKDNRIGINDKIPELYVYSPAVQIISFFPDGTAAQGSGTMIGNNDVLTAAHVIYSAENGGYATYFEVTPVRIDTLKPFGMIYASEAIAATGWIYGENFTSDYGLITLESPVGYQTFWIEPSIASVSIGTPLSSFGYPGDLNDGNSLYRSDGTVDKIAFRSLQFSDDMDIMGGQSGSGVFSITNTSIALLGLVSYDSDYPLSHNGILAFDSTIVSQLKSWSLANDSTLTPILDTDDSLQPIVEKIDLLHYAIFNSSAEKSWLNTYIQAYQSGKSLLDISLTVFSKESLPSNVTVQDNGTFLTYVFETLLQINYSLSDYSYWLTQLNNGYSRAEGLMLCSTLESFANLHKLDTYVTWHDNYQSYGIEAFANDESSYLIAKTEDSALWGGIGNDTLEGKEGDDYLYGAEGNDTLIGGTGEDFFAWNVGDGFDTVKDFSLTDDTLRLRSEFAWKWMQDSAGNALLQPTFGYGYIILVGISLSETDNVHIIQSEV